MVLRSGFNSRGSNQRRRKETHHGTQPCGCGRHDRRKRGRTPEKTLKSLGLTSTVFIAEVVSAIVTGSLALLVDAGHMLTDMSVLIASTVTAVLMQRQT